MKHSKQVGSDDSSSSEDVGSGCTVVCGEDDDADSTSESDAESSSGTVTRSDGLLGVVDVVVRVRRARSSSRPMELRSSVVSRSDILLHSLA